ncbi:MAG: TonB-dependent receptor [Thiobacillus sp.]|nr:TonB-dependent receptor [Thiobacillus sp.]
MNKQLLLLALSAALGVSSAHAADTGFYVGGSLGQSKIDISASDIDAELASAGYPSSTSVDDSDTGWKLFAGYRIMKYLAVEGAYTNLGEASANSIITAPPGVVNATVEGEAWTVSALGILPIGDKFSLFGRLGVNIWNVDVSATGTNSGATATVAGSDDGTDMVYGVGAAYRFTDNLSLRGEWERYDFGDTDVDLLSAGISWDF